MTTSVSTPRLRITLLWYLALLIISIFTHPAPMNPLISTAVDTLALLAVIGACLGRIWCSIFIAGRKDTELVTDGPYALCRHPLYSLSILGGVGLGCATHSIVLTTLTLVILLSLFRQAIITEEKYLALHHEKIFLNYLKCTPRFLPSKIGFNQWLQTLPSEISIKPNLLWKAFIDAGAFMLLYAVIHTVELLHLSQVLPSLLLLP